MKARSVILFAASVLGGWWIAATPVASSAIRTWRASFFPGKPSEHLSENQLAAGLPRESEGQVQVSAEQIRKLLDADDSPVFRAENFTGDGYKSHLGVVANWLGLDAGSEEQLVGVLRDACAGRFAWEKVNASVSKPESGKWVLEIPGDGGAADSRLRADLKTAFGEEQAETIILTADLAHFFELPPDLERAKSPAGKIEVEAARFAGEPIEGQQGDLFFRVRGQGSTMVCTGEFYEQSSLSRVKHLLPSYPQIRDAARVVPRPKVVPEGDTFVNPFDS